MLQRGARGTGAGSIGLRANATIGFALTRERCVSSSQVNGPIVGRAAELAAFAHLANSTNGLSVLTFVGDPGIGKTTVLQSIANQAIDHRVLACRPSPNETRLSFAGLVDLLLSVDDVELAALPTPQRRALNVALLRAEPHDPVDPADQASGNPSDADVRTLGTGLTTLLKELSARRPLLLVLDDAHWLDTATARALEFALRRADSSPITVIASVRTTDRGEWTRITNAIAPERVRTHTVVALTRDELRELLMASHGAPLSVPQLRRIHRSSAGNPFYALELSRVLLRSTRDAAGDDAVDADPLIPERVETLVAERLRELPTRTRNELLRACALGVPTVELLDMDALAPAEEAGIIRTRSNGHVVFDHPLFAGAVLALASPQRLRRLHAELAAVVDGVEERAVHLQRSTFPPNEDVAAALSASASAAARRGALDAAAQFAEQALAFTRVRDTQLGHERSLAAASLQLQIGDRERARALAQRAAATKHTGGRARALQLLAETYALEDPRSSVPLLEEALALVPDDLAYAAHLHLLLAGAHVTLMEFGASMTHHDACIDLASRSGAMAVLATALGQRAPTAVMMGLDLDEPSLQVALTYESHELLSVFQARASLMVAMAYIYTGQVDRARPILLRLRDWLVDRGNESELSYACILLAITSVLSGEFATAADEAEQALRAATWSGQDLFRSFALMVRGLVRTTVGTLDDARHDHHEALAIAQRIGWPVGIGQAMWGLGFLAVTEGDMATAASHLRPMVDGIEAMGVYEWPVAMSLPDGLEALVATGDVDRAATVSEAFASWARRVDRPWGLASAARCEALIAAARGDLEVAEAAGLRAVREHDRLTMPFELARTLLVLGQIQRRRLQRGPARATLQRAVGLFTAMGATPWAERADAELRRTGVRKPRTGLTETEARVAELAAQGMLNREIAAQLFISVRTVESNLGRAYRKLGIASRAELGALMGRAPRP